MASEYDVFVDSFEELPEGVEIDISVRELTPQERQKKYRGRYVKAVVSSSPDKLPGADKLWVRFSRGLLHPSPWYIKIISDVGEYKPEAAQGWRT